MIYFGTSGFSYQNWLGIFYPLGMPKREWLTYYSREFNTGEVNSTFYAIPKPSSLKAVVSKTSDDFLFCFKANQDMTHKQGDEVSVFRNFCQVLKPVVADNVAERTFVFANNHRYEQAVDTTRQLRVMLN